MRFRSQRVLAQAATLGTFILSAAAAPPAMGNTLDGERFDGQPGAITITCDPAAGTEGNFGAYGTTTGAVRGTFYEGGVFDVDPETGALTRFEGSFQVMDPVTGRSLVEGSMYLPDAGAGTDPRRHGRARCFEGGEGGVINARDVRYEVTTYNADGTVAGSDRGRLLVSAVGFVSPSAIPLGWFRQRFFSDGSGRSPQLGGGESDDDRPRPSPACDASALRRERTALRRRQHRERRTFAAADPTTEERRAFHAWQRQERRELAQRREACTADD